MDKKKTITIDGPAGAGKSTVGKILAERLGYEYLDTGAIYRALAFRVLDSGTDELSEERIGIMAQGVSISLHRNTEGLRIFLDGCDITAFIRTPEIGMLASTISAYSAVRKALLIIQRELGRYGGIVADGRDMGTVVFPSAEHKFYLVADEAIRVGRRYLELRQKTDEIELSDVQEDIRKRDKQDQERQLAPLKPAPDAVFIDSTGMGIMEVVDKMLSFIH